MSVIDGCSCSSRVICQCHMGSVNQIIFRAGRYVITCHMGVWKWEGGIICQDESGKMARGLLTKMELEPWGAIKLTPSAETLEHLTIFTFTTWLYSWLYSRYRLLWDDFYKIANSYSFRWSGVSERQIWTGSKIFNALWLVGFVKSLRGARVQVSDPDAIVWLPCKYFSPGYCFSAAYRYTEPLLPYFRQWPRSSRYSLTYTSPSRTAPNLHIPHSSMVMGSIQVRKCLVLCWTLVWNSFSTWHHFIHWYPYVFSQKRRRHLSLNKRLNISFRSFLVLSCMALCPDIRV